MNRPAIGLEEQMLRAQFAARLPGAEGDFALEADFAAGAGFTIVFGASGAGKTTLLDCIAGLRTPQTGRIAIEEAVLFDSGSRINLPANRRSVGYLMQTPALFPHMTVLQNVQYGLAKLDRGDRERRSREILDSFGIASLSQRKPGAISGGEGQRVALARTLVTRPRVLLLDEPLTALDRVTKQRILDDLRAWNQRQQIPILYVTHDREEVFALGERVLVMDNGRIVAQGTPHEALSRPQLESVAQLAGFENILEGRIVALHAEQGTMTCEVAAGVSVEVPLTRLDNQRSVSVGIRGGDILLATQPPQGLSARNLLRGTITAMRQQDVTVIAEVDCGVTFAVHLTPGARDSLRLQVGLPVWLIIKTYSCHVLR